MRAGLFLAAALALMMGACDKPKPGEPQVEGHAAATGKLTREFAGRAAAATPFLGPNDEPVSLASFRGKPVLVNLWATWCAPCITEMPSLDTLAARNDVQVVAISQDMAGRRAVTPFFDKMKFRALKPYLDKEMLLGEQSGAGGLPVTILYDAKGQEVWRVNGAFDWSSPETARLLTEAGKA